MVFSLNRQKDSSCSAHPYFQAPPRVARALRRTYTIQQFNEWRSLGQGNKHHTSCTTISSMPHVQLTNRSMNHTHMTS